MTDDVTTKPCPYCGGKPEIGPCSGQWRSDGCHGTGRVPMDTGELLEALFADGWDVKIYRTAYGVRVDVDNGSDYLTTSGKFKTPDDALRAALRAVSHD